MKSMKRKWRIIVPALIAGMFIAIYFWHNWKYRYYLDDNGSKTITIANIPIKFIRKDDARITTVYFSNLSIKSIKLHVSYYMIFHNGVDDPINWLITMQKQDGSGYIGVNKPDKDALALNYGAEQFELKGQGEYRMEIPRHPQLYIAPAEEVIPDTSPTSSGTNGR